MTPNQQARSASPSPKGSQQFSQRKEKRNERFRPDPQCTETGVYDTVLDRCVKQYDVDTGNDIAKLVQANEKCAKDYEALNGKYKVTRNVMLVNAATNMVQSGIILAPMVMDYAARRRRGRGPIPFVNGRRI